MSQVELVILPRFFMVLLWLFTCFILLFPAVSSVVSNSIGEKMRESTATKMAMADGFSWGYCPISTPRKNYTTMKYKK